MNEKKVCSAAGMESNANLHCFYFLFLNALKKKKKSVVVEMYANARDRSGSSFHTDLFPKLRLVKVFVMAHLMHRG